MIVGLKKIKKNKESQYMVSHLKPVRIRQSGRTGIGGVISLVVSEPRFRRFWKSLCLGDSR